MKRPPQTSQEETTSQVSLTTTSNTINSPSQNHVTTGWRSAAGEHPQQPLCPVPAAQVRSRWGVYLPLPHFHRIFRRVGQNTPLMRRWLSVLIPFYGCSPPFHNRTLFSSCCFRLRLFFCRVLHMGLCFFYVVKFFFPTVSSKTCSILPRTPWLWLWNLVRENPSERPFSFVGQERPYLSLNLIQAVNHLWGCVADGREHTPPSGLVHRSGHHL